MSSTGTLLFESNVISLRSAVVVEEAGFVYFTLTPRSLDSSLPGILEHARSEHTWLYRKKKSLLGEVAFKFGFFPLEQAVKPILLKSPPEFKVLWADSGHSVALLLNGEPWAFIVDGKNKGYSKGILKPTIGNPWDESIFEKTFVT